MTTHVEHHHKRGGVKLPEVSKSKAVRVFRNGDEFYKGRKLVINRIPDFDAFLEQCTSGIQPKFGAVRKIYTPTGGTIVQSLEDLEDGQTYVAAGKERFRKIKYETIQTQIEQKRIKNRRGAPKKDATGDLKLPPLPHGPPRVARSGRARKLGAYGPRRILVLTNGDISKPAVPILLTRKAAMTFDQVLENITLKVKPGGRAVRKLYLLDGTPVTNLEDIKNGGQYVASTGGFRKLPYTTDTRKQAKLVAEQSKVRRAKSNLLPFQKDSYQVRAPKQQLAKTSPTRGKVSPKRGYIRRKPSITTALPAFRPESPFIVEDTKTPPRSAVRFDDSADLSKGSPLVRRKTPKPRENPPTPEPVKLAPEKRIQAYNVRIETGDDDGAGTDAQVYLTLKGDTGDSGKRLLNEDRDNFAIGATDIFPIEAKAVGEIKSILLEQDGSGPASAWFVKRIVVRDVLNSKKYYFHINKWLAEDRGDFSKSVEVPASSSPEPPQQIKNTSLPDVEDEFLAKGHGDEDAEQVDDSEDVQQDLPVDMRTTESVGDGDDEVDEVGDGDEVDESSDGEGGELDMETLKEKVMKGDDVDDEVVELLQSKEKLRDVWNELDYNNNGIVSLAEIDKLVVSKKWKLSKPALMRAYKQTTLKDGDGDSWVERKELPALMRNLFFMQRLWTVFDGIDTDDDRRIDLAEFRAGIKKLGCHLSKAEAKANFDQIDTNGGGIVLFHEFCHYIANCVAPDTPEMEELEKQAEKLDAERDGDSSDDEADAADDDGEDDDEDDVEDEEANPEDN